MEARLPVGLVWLPSAGSSAGPKHPRVLPHSPTLGFLCSPSTWFLVPVLSARVSLSMVADFQKRERKQKAPGHLSLRLEWAQSHFHRILCVKESREASRKSRGGDPGPPLSGRSIVQVQARRSCWQPPSGERTLSRTLPATHQPPRVTGRSWGSPCSGTPQAGGCVVC